MSSKKTFKQYLAETEATRGVLPGLIELFEHEVFGRIPGSRNSYVEHPGNTNTLTLKHSHVYAKPQGQGKQLYAANVNGTGHDGSSGIEISKSHADFFRSKGYEIPPSNILEGINYELLEEQKHFVYILSDA